MAPAIELRGVVVCAGGRVLLDVPRLALAPGERLAVLGPNGAGKSTLLQVAALLRRPDAGEVWIAERKAERRSEAELRRRMAVVFQEPLLFDTGVLANAASGLRFRGAGRREAEERATAWSGRFGVAHLAGRNARSLSGGEAQRVNLARAFALEPAILLLDEPFAGLDGPTRAVLVPELAGWLEATGVTAVLVTHDAWEADALATTRIHLTAGRIVEAEMA